MRLGDENDLPDGGAAENHGSLQRDTEHPLDVAALRADDEFVERLAAGLVAPRDVPDSARGTDDELVAMLAAWVAEVRPEAIAAASGGAEARTGTIGAAGADTTTSDAGASDAGTVEPEPGATITPLRRPGRHRAVNTYGRRLAVAAALVVLATSGMAVGASDAEPGSVLWPVSKVFYAERARSVEAAIEVSTHLEQARVALREGRPDEAARQIDAAAAQLPNVRPAEGRDNLARAQQQIVESIDTASAPDTANPSAPGAPTDGQGADESVLASPPAPGQEPGTDPGSPAAPGEQEPSVAGDPGSGPTGPEGTPSAAEPQDPAGPADPAPGGEPQPTGDPEPTGEPGARARPRRLRHRPRTHRHRTHRHRRRTHHHVRRRRIRHRLG